ncbi:hypothetical protein AB7M35_002188 [Amorphus suaedae]
MATSFSSSSRPDGPRWSVEGFAIVSDDDRIADADGRMPDALRNEADWRAFQAGLDRMNAVLLGRRSHQMTPNRTGRLRIVVSSRAHGIERRDDAWWWSPQIAAIPEMLATVLPEGGAIGVPGGRGVFDMFLAYGYDAFHLTRAHGVALPGGTPLFSDCASGRAEAVLARHGLVSDPETILDPDWSITQTVWRRAHSGEA